MHTSDNPTIEINVATIAPSRWQPRQYFAAGALIELARSITDQGLINPVLVFRNNGNYELIAGERRTRAVTALALWQLFPDAHTLRDWCERLATVGLLGIGAEERAALAAEPGAVIKATLHLLRNWDKFDDGGMATLLTALIFEVKAFTGNYRKPFTLMDLRDGRVDTWMSINLKDRNTEQRDWPDQWMKPWTLSQ